MTDVASLIADLVAAGTSAALVGRVAAALAAPSEDDELSADRRERDRIRKRNSRDKSKVTSADGHADIPRTTSEPSPPPAPSPDKEIPPTPPKENNLFPEPSPHPDVDGREREKIRRGSRLRDDWTLPKAWGEWAMAEFPFLSRENVVAIAAEFRDYWISIPGTKGCKLDWEATWRNRVRERAPRGQPRASPKADSLEDVEQRLKERIENEHGIGRQDGRNSRDDARIPLLESLGQNHR